MAAPIIAVPESVKAAQLASIDKLSKRLQDLKPEEICSVEVEVPEAFSCAVCHDLFIKPRQCFPCRHCFCEPCLRQVANSEIHVDADYCPCPLCREPIHFSRPDKSLEAEILRSSLANLYAERSGAYARKSEMQAMPLPGLALLSFLPSISPSYRRINRVLSFITFALLWVYAKSTRSLLLDFFLLRTLASWLVLLFLCLITTFLLMLCAAARFVLLEFRFVELGANYCSARRLLLNTCPVPHFPDPLQVVVEEVSGDVGPEEVVYPLVTLCVFLSSSCGPIMRLYGFRRLGNAVSFIGVCGMCAWTLFSLLHCTPPLFAAVALIFRN